MAKVVLDGKRQGMCEDYWRNEYTSKGRHLILCLLRPHLELLLGHLQVLDMGDGMVQKRNLARLLVSDGERNK
jgi:hypothetical protein